MEAVASKPCLFICRLQLCIGRKADNPRIIVRAKTNTSTLRPVFFRGKRMLEIIESSVASSTTVKDRIIPVLFIKGSENTAGTSHNLSLLDRKTKSSARIVPPKMIPRIWSFVIDNNPGPKYTVAEAIAKKITKRLFIFFFTNKN